jgi:hypothetical protein
MESAIRTAIDKMQPGTTTTAKELGHRLGLDEAQVGIWLDVLAGEGLLIPEHRVLSELRPGAEHVVRYRLPVQSAT